MTKKRKTVERYEGRSKRFWSLFANVSKLKFPTADEKRKSDLAEGGVEWVCDSRCFNKIKQSKNVSKIIKLALSHAFTGIYIKMIRSKIVMHVNAPLYKAAVKAWIFHSYNRQCRSLDTSTFCIFKAFSSTQTVIS